MLHSSSAADRITEETYLQGLGINIPPLNIPHETHGHPSASIAQPFQVPQTRSASEGASNASTSSDNSPPPMSSLLDCRLMRPLSPSTTLLSVSSMDSLPGPITPLATPPPSPGGSRVSSLVRLSAADMLTASGCRSRSDSIRSMCDLFGSDD